MYFKFQTSLTHHPSYEQLTQSPSLKPLNSSPNKLLQGDNLKLLISCQCASERSSVSSKIQIERKKVNVEVQVNRSLAQHDIHTLSLR